MRFCLVAALLSMPAAAAGSPPESPLPTFRATTELVALTVTVTKAAQHLAGLSASDFVVLEEGVEQPLSYFAASDVPLDVTLLVDASSSMGDKMNAAREAVRGLARSLRPADRAAVVEFRQNTVRRQEMTGDRAAVEAAIDRMAARGGTALYTALYISLSELQGTTDRDGIRRQALVVLSDGDDTASLIGYEDVLEKARRSGIAIYPITLRSPTVARELRGRRGVTGAVTDGDHALRELARETGGTSYFPGDVRELREIYRRIAAELGQQYVLGYTPTTGPQGGEFRRVLVRLPAHPRAQLRSRSGYFADTAPAVTVTRLFDQP